MDDNKQNFQINKENQRGEKIDCHCYHHQKKRGLESVMQFSLALFLCWVVSFLLSSYVQVHKSNGNHSAMSREPWIQDQEEGWVGNCAFSGRREFCRHTVGGTKGESLSGVHRGVSSWTSPLGRQQKACPIEHWSVPGFLKGVSGWDAHYDTISVWCAPCSPRLHHTGCGGVSGIPWSYKIWETKTMNCLGKEREREREKSDSIW